MSTTEPAINPTRQARRVAIIGILIVGIVLAAAVTGIGMLLGGTGRDGTALDKAQPIVVGAIVAPGQELTGGMPSLPPLALVTTDPTPSVIAQLPLIQQVAHYRTIASNDPNLLVKLGAAAQRASDPDVAEAAYRKALAVAPGSLEATIGLALVAGSRSDAGLKAAGRTLVGITTAHPQSQVAWFNRGWVDAYLRDGKGTIAAWQRTAALDPSSALGTTASGLLTRIARAQKASGTG